MKVAVVESSHISWKQHCKGCKPNTDFYLEKLQRYTV